MKQGLLFIFLFTTSAMLAQINPCALGGNGQERKVGFKVDRLPDDFDLGIPGDNNRWVFSSLKSATYLEYRFLDAREGRYRDYFAEADYVLSHPDGNEDYFYVDRGKWYNVGRALLEPDAIEPIILTFKIPLSGCLPRLNAATSLYGTQYEVGMTKDGVMQQYVIRENYTDLQDARGRLYLPQGIYDAYRVKREVSYETALTPSESPVPIDGYTSYVFLDEVTDEVLLELRLDEAGAIKSGTYLSGNTDTQQKPKVGPNQFTLYPSTSFGDIRLDFVNFKRGRYYFEVYNIIGKKLWSNTYDLSGDMTIKEDLTNLPKGTYVYTILDEDRNNIVTKRLAIINP